MDFIDKIKNTIGVGGSDDYDDGYDDDYEDYDDDEYEDEAPKAQTIRKDSAEPDDYDDEEDYPDEPAPVKKGFISKNKSSERVQKKSTTRKGGKNMAMKSTDRISAIVSAKIPRNDEDTTEIVEMLLQGNAVLINVEGVGADAAQRVIDYVAGACYAIDGKFQKVSHTLFVACPKDVQLDGDYIEDLGVGFPLPSFPEYND